VHKEREIERKIFLRNKLAKTLVEGKEKKTI
jgi:hypothetical protein